MTEPNEDAKNDLQRLHREVCELKAAVDWIWWMARRYANGRSTYAPHQFNIVTQSLRQANLLTDTDNGEMWASDGDFGKWDPDTKQFEGEK